MPDLDLDQLYFAIVDGNAKAAAAITKEAVAANVEPQTLLTDYMIPVSYTHLGVSITSSPPLVVTHTERTRPPRVSTERTRPDRRRTPAVRACSSITMPSCWPLNQPQRRAWSAARLSGLR